MEHQPGHATHLGMLLEAHRNGDQGARAEILEHTCERLRMLASRMLGNFANVKRWAQTDDVLQEAMLRLHRSLEDQQPEDVRQFYGLAALQIRRELIDLARHFQGPHGIGHNHRTDEDGGPSRAAQAKAEVDGPESLESWVRFHEAMEKLPEKEREVANLIWYGDLPQEEVARNLGVSLSSVKRLWHLARMRLKKLWKEG